MSTPAPAAPNTGGGASPQPAAGAPPSIPSRPAVDAPGGPAPSTSADPAQQTEATGKDGIEVRGTQGERIIRPIPPKKTLGKLPGVDVMGDEADPNTSTIPAPPQRGPDGRFVKADPNAAPTADPSAPPAPGDPDATVPPASKFKFAGEEWESQEKAEQNFRSLRGQFKPLADRVARVEAEAKETTATLHRAAESARGWKAEHDRVAAELEAYRSGKPPQSGPADPSTPPADAEQGIDWELYAEIHRLATEQGTPWKAEQWLVKQQQALIDQRLAAMKDEVTRPHREAEARQQIAAQTDALFTAVSEYVNSDGSPAFPELGDPEAAYQIGQLWTSLGLPPEAALTPQGAIAAVSLYRMASGSQGKSAAAQPPTPSAAPPSTPNPQAALAAAAAAGLDTGRPSVVNFNGNPTLSPEAARIVAGLKQATLVRPGLGFEP
jgi:hypothetical protein